MITREDVERLFHGAHNGHNGGHCRHERVPLTELADEWAKAGLFNNKGEEVLSRATASLAERLAGMVDEVAAASGESISEVKPVVALAIAHLGISGLFQFAGGLPPIDAMRAGQQTGDAIAKLLRAKGGGELAIQFNKN